MKNFIKKLSLKQQLLTMTILVIIISFLASFVLLPQILKPFYENNIYEILKQPLGFIRPENKSEDSEIVFLIRTPKNIIVSNNFDRLIRNVNYHDILNRATKNEGKITIHGHIYYYSRTVVDGNDTLTLTDDTIVRRSKENLMQIIFPTFIITFLFIGTIILIWGNYLVKKIGIIKNKVANLNNENYPHSDTFKINDELNSLIISIEKMRETLKKDNEEKNNLFQNISHELKTPIAIIKNYLEACNDKVVPTKEALEVIEEEINVLNKQVASILELNKIEYITNSLDYKKEMVNFVSLLRSKVDKYKKTNKKIKFVINEVSDDILLKGTDDMWETIIDNILSNFMRYANKSIEITIAKDKIIFFNDGEKIDYNIINDLFIPYKKGLKGEVGLGLAIVKRMLDVLNYEIKVKNADNGVIFTIEI
jgi:two-component system sensor histidine kinase CssS